MSKFSESSYNILNTYFEAVKATSDEQNSYLMGSRKTIVSKGGVVTHLYEKRSTGEFVGYKFRIIEISGNNFKFTYDGLLKSHTLADGDITIGSEMYFRKDAFFYDWLVVNESLYKDDINTNKTYIYFGKIYEVLNEVNTYNVVFEGMKDYMISALPGNNRTTNLQEFLKIYFDHVHHSVYNMTKNLWSMIDPKEVDIRFLNLIALDYGIEIDEDLSESSLREWVDTVIYFLKRKGDYSSIYIIYKLLLGNTENKLNIYERWAEWCSSELSDTPSFEDDHHILEYYNTQAEGGAGIDYYSQYNPSNYPTYTDTAPSGECLKEIWICGSTENYNSYSGVDTNSRLEIVNRNKLTITDFDKSSDDLYLSISSTTPSGDFLHCVKTTMSSASSAGAGLAIWGVANQNAIFEDITLGSWFCVCLDWYNDAYQFRLMESWDDNNLQQWEYSTNGYNVETDYYLGIERNSSDLSLYIFDNEDRSNLLETVSLEISGDVPSLGAFSYLYALNTIGSAGAANWTGDVENLATGAVGASGINLTGNLILTPHYKVELDLSSEPIGDEYIINEYLMNELVRYWNYTKPVSKYVHYEQLIAPICKMDEEGEYVSLYDEHQNAFLNTQFTGTSFLSAAPVAPSGNNPGAGTYKHSQTVASYDWVIDHELETRDIIIQSYNNDKELIKANEININNKNRVTLEFNNAVGGEAYIADIRSSYDYLHTETTKGSPPVITVNTSTENIETSATSGGTFIDVNEDGNVYVSYHDYINDKIKYATKVSDTWSTENIDSGGKNNAIQLDSSSMSHVIYNYSNDNIVYANKLTGSWIPVIVGSDGKDGNLGLAIDSLDNPHVIYSAETPGGVGILKHAIKSGGLWSYDTIDTSPSGNYQDISVTIDSSNNLHISYVDDTINELKYATGDTDSWTISTANVSGSTYTSIVLDNNEKVHISYVNTSDEYKHVTNSSGLWVKYTIDNSVGPNFKYSSLGIDSDDILHTVYSTDTELKYGKFYTTSWTDWTNAVISQTPSGATNMGFSVKVDDFDNIHVTYSEHTSDSNAYVKYFTLTSEVSGSNSFDWDISHNLATSGASGVVAQFYNNDYIRNMMVPSAHDYVDGDNIKAEWNSANAYTGTAPVRRVDFNNSGNIGSTWNINHELDAGGLIIECSNTSGNIINPNNITLLTSNSASIYFSQSTSGSVDIIYIPKTFVIESSLEDVIGIGIGENLGYWKIGNGTQQDFDPITANDIQSITLSGSYDNVYENDSETYYIVEFVISSVEDLTITEIGLFNDDGNIMFYTLCSSIFKPANIDLRLFYRIEKIEE